MSIPKLILGPELYWGLVYAAISAIAARNVPPTEAFSASLENLWYAVPIIAIPLSFAVFAVRGPGRWVLLARTNLACLVGLFFAAARVSSAIDYQDSRNSGVLAGFVISLGLGIVVLFVTDVIAMTIILLGRRKGALTDVAR
ncbi:MAG: hypothetical protein WC655_25495 [Candidatus Hydrogenedentales bacterium]